MLGTLDFQISQKQRYVFHELGFLENSSGRWYMTNSAGQLSYLVFMERQDGTNCIMIATRLGPDHWDYTSIGTYIAEVL